MSITILLVEDHKILREGTRQLLEQYPDLQVVGEACDGLEAVRMAADLLPDVIVMDVRLPRMNGIEATQAITARHSKVKVLILSAYADDSYVFPLLEAGASGYLLKTASGAELADAIRLVYAGETALSPRISAKLVNRLGGRQPYRNQDSPEGLTEREMDVLRAVAQGRANKTIAAELRISTQTVQVHLRNIFGKLGVSSRSEAVAHAIQYGWITLEPRDE
ncbi:MAG TPA: response regulator transcription factor [Anaerolineaceae bacterium]|nr:response regulator transcription factor [Anaerolineaceae bacterium]